MSFLYVLYRLLKMGCSSSNHELSHPLGIRIIVSSVPNNNLTTPTLDNISQRCSSADLWLKYKQTTLEVPPSPEPRGSSGQNLPQFVLT